jgi:hypothetical protein
MAQEKQREREAYEKAKEQEFQKILEEKIGKANKILDATLNSLKQGHEKTKTHLARFLNRIQGAEEFLESKPGKPLETEPTFIGEDEEKKTETEREYESENEMFYKENFDEWRQEQFDELEEEIVQLVKNDYEELVEELDLSEDFGFEELYQQATSPDKKNKQ